MTFYLLIAALSFLVLYFAVKKLTLQIDEKALTEPVKVSVYPEFCDIISQKIRDLQNEVKFGEDTLYERTQRNECLEKFGDLTRKLIFIQTMNLSKKNDKIWQNELFGFLSEFEKVIKSYLKDGERKSDELRNALLKEFERLQKESE